MVYDMANDLGDLRDFICEWRYAREAGNTEPVLSRRSMYGNINESGLPGDYRSRVITPHRPEFHEIIEPGVRELVRMLVERHDLLTYSSCEGHFYRGLVIAPVPRQVSLLPESVAAAGFTLRGLQRVLSCLKHNDAVRGKVDVELLYGPMAWLGIKLILEPAGDWCSYFSAVDEYTSELVAELGIGALLMCNE